MSSSAEPAGSRLQPPDGPGAREDGVWLSTADDVAVDLLVDGQRIWSFNPMRDAEQVNGLYRVPWPPVLRSRLAGIGRVAAREHVSGRVLFDAETQFGDSTARLRFVDDEGYPLAISKSGEKANKLSRSFADSDPAAVDELVSAAEAAIALIREKAGLPAFLAYGTLLGAVRDGHLIGHDVDIDLGILTESPFPVDVVRTSFGLERLFRREGWQTWRFSGGDFKVRAADAEHHPWMDVFSGFYADGTFYLLGRLAVPADQLTLLPLSEVEFEGHRLPAPADPVAMLEAAYGPGWRLPDPSFVPDVPPSTKRRMNAWMRSAITNRNYWYGLYGAHGDELPTTPSQFARYFAEREAPRAPVIDLGCGNGRDAVWLAEQGYDVRGYDYAPQAVSQARSLARKRGVRAQFDKFNLYDTRHVLALGGLLAHEPEPVHLYGRFLLHALTKLGVSNLWLLARTCLRRGGRLYLEFLAPDPAGEPSEHVFEEHFRNPLDPAAVTRQIEASGGRVEHTEVGRGLAVFQNEDPYICRMVASWSR